METVQVYVPKALYSDISVHLSSFVECWEVGGGGIKVNANNVTAERAGVLLACCLYYLVLGRIRFPVGVPLLAVIAVLDPVR